MMQAMLKSLLAALFALFFAVPAAWAACSAGQSQLTTVQVAVISGQGSGKVNVPKSSPVGTTVWTSPTITLPGVNVNCFGQQGYAVHKSGLPASGLPNVFKTDIPYLGVKIVEVTSFTSVAGSATPWATPAYGFSGSLSPSYQVSLVVIAPITNNTNNDSSSLGVPIAQDYISDSAVNLSNASELHALRLASFNTQITGNSPCATSNVTVNLGNHTASEFGAIGSTTVATDFAIQLSNCPAGMRRIAYQIDPATSIVPGTGNSVVTLTAASLAKGVGVQLLDATGAPMALASQQTIGDSGGAYTILLKARYYKTGSFISGGSANSAMTFTITYN